MAFRTISLSGHDQKIIKAVQDKLFPKHGPVPSARVVRMALMLLAGKVRVELQNSEIKEGE